MILAFPYMFFTLDAGFRSIDVHYPDGVRHTASFARWTTTTLFRVILPISRPAALAGSFLTPRDRDGEFTIATWRRSRRSDLHPVRDESQWLPGRCAHADELCHHLGRDALAARFPFASGRGAGPLAGYASMTPRINRIDYLHYRTSIVTSARQALNGIDISLGEGEFLVAARALGLWQDDRTPLGGAGFDRPEAGSSWTARTSRGCLPQQRDMGMVFPGVLLVSDMNRTAERRLRPQDQGREKDDRTSVWTTCWSWSGSATRRPAIRTSSRRMQQRVAWRVLSRSSRRVLLLDEPLSALDAKVAVQLLEEIRRIPLELGITTRMVTHDQDEALAIVRPRRRDVRGVIEQMGTRGRDVHGAGDAFVAEFIGT